MEIAFRTTTVSRVLMDNDGPGVKVGRTLQNGNVLLVWD